MANLNLMFSSLFFMIPCVMAWKKKMKKDAILSSVLATSSVLNHGVSSDYVQTIDKIYVHALVTYFMMFRKSNMFEKMCLYSLPYVFYVKRNGPKANFWHMVLHAVGVIGWSFHILQK